MVKLITFATTAALGIAAAESVAKFSHHSSFSGLISRAPTIVKTNKARLNTKKKSSKQLRTLKGKKDKDKKGKGGSSAGELPHVLLTVFDGTDCSTGIEAGAIAIGPCNKGLTSEGIAVSSMYTSSNPGDALSVVENWYAGHACEGDAISSEDLMDDFPPHEGSTYGDCVSVEGVFSFRVDYSDGAPTPPGFDAILGSIGSTYEDCAEEEFGYYDASAVGICFEEDDGSSYIYDITGCDTGGAFTKTIYSDAECATETATINANEDTEVCKFDFANLYSIRESGDTNTIDYRTSVCNFGSE